MFPSLQFKRYNEWIRAILKKKSCLRSNKNSCDVLRRLSVFFNCYPSSAVAHHVMEFDLLKEREGPSAERTSAC